MTNNKIRVGILGYGNLGKGVECSINQNDDMELVGVFTRRNPDTVKLLSKDVNVYNVDKLDTMTNEIDVLILCGGSATDLPEMTPKYASLFNVVDSFDTHAKIPEHFERVNKASIEAKKVAAISIGWDPGMFSLNRAIMEAILPAGETYTFWGKGVSQGHSDAIRRIDGVIDGRQYTIPVDLAVENVRSGKNPKLTTREKHTRYCYIVAEENADKSKIENEIVNMPNYFDEYDTTVEFITMEEMKANHSGLPHGGMVIRSGNTGVDNLNNEVVEYKLKLDSNPEFTASILTAYARAVVKLAKEGNYGCKSVFDIAPAYLINMSAEDMRKKLL